MNVEAILDLSPLYRFSVLEIYVIMVASGTVYQDSLNAVDALCY